MALVADWFTVDKKGLKNLLGGKKKSFIIAELIQNGWDQPGTTQLDVSLIKQGRNSALVTVTDNDPDGFADLTHAWTLFADTAKRGNPIQRGRFNIGEKRVLAFCRRATIASTTGTVIFGPNGRRQSSIRLAQGSQFVGDIEMTDIELREVESFITTLLTPKGIRTTFNNVEIPYREPIAVIEGVPLPTEIAEVGEPLRRTIRQTDVEIHEVKIGEEASIYEMGIPVVATGDKYHVNIMQKVPLNVDRDNVTPAFLQTIRSLVLNETFDQIDVDDVNTDWVRAATSDNRCSDEVITKAMDLRFGEKRVAYDPSDPEANNKAFAQGYTVVHGPQMSATEWNNAKRANTILPAGQVTPAKPKFSGTAPCIDEDELTTGMKEVRNYTRFLAQRLMGVDLDVVFLDGRGVSATYEQNGPTSSTLVYYVLTLGKRWFDLGNNALDIDRLIIHEFGHQYSSNHLDSAYHEALCRLGAKLKRLYVQEPKAFRYLGPQS